MPSRVRFRNGNGVIRSGSIRRVLTARCSIEIPPPLVVDMLTIAAPQQRFAASRRAL
jgi:hypothetical protein